MKYIFVHGLGQTEKSWDNIIPEFNSNEVHRPNLQTLLGANETTYDNLYHCFKEYCNVFSEPINLCGISLGGVLALNYAIDYPSRVNSLILIGTQYKMPKVLLKMQNAVFHILPKSLFSNMGFSKKDFISITNSMVTLDFTSQLSNIICKSIIICGDKDAANKKASITLSKRIKGSRLVFIKNSNHEINVDNPVALLNVINNFYDEIV